MRATLWHWFAESEIHLAYINSTIISYLRKFSYWIYSKLDSFAYWDTHKHLIA